MAGDWIKIECTTPSKPEVDAIAEHLGITVNEVIGGLVRLWIWADQQTVDGNAASVTKSAIDRHSGVTGLADSMLLSHIHWLEKCQTGGFQFPNFDRHNGQTAKTRALTAKRVARSKKRKGNAEVTLSALPREEKRREDKSTTYLSSSDDENGKSEIEKSKLPISVKTFFSQWQQFAASKALPVPRSLTDQRQQKIRSRLRAAGWYETFLAACSKLPIPNDHEFTWQPDLDWLLKNDTNVAKLAEGRYDRRTNTTREEPYV